MGQCLSPLLLKENPTPIPCGKCLECRKRLISSWSFRLLQQAKHSTMSHFITLTYATTTVPITRNGFMSLRKEDLQKYFKRLRKLCPDSVVKYFAVGEYGSRTMRPHYHIILFGANDNAIIKAWALDNKPIGNLHIGRCTPASVAYSLKYVMKPGKIPLHRNDDRVPEFRIMSKGLGIGYITEAMAAWHAADIENRGYCVVEGGKKIAMPRYYKDKIYFDHERKAIAEAGLRRALQEEFMEMMKDDEYAMKQYRERQEKAKAAKVLMSKRAIKGDKF